MESAQGGREGAEQVFGGIGLTLSCGTWDGLKASYQVAEGVGLLKPSVRCPVIGRASPAVRWSGGPVRLGLALIPLVARQDPWAGPAYHGLCALPTGVGVFALAVRERET